VASRSKRFILGVASGYGFIAVNIAYTMLSIPLALHYLGKEEFGLWALALQISGYLMLLDLGMSSAVSRFIANHKDDVNGGEYGSLLLTGGIVFLIQGAMIALIGAVFSWFAGTLFAVPEHLQEDFRNVLIILTSLSGLSIAFRSFGAPLWAFHRIDVANGLGIFTLTSSLATLWIGFHFGWGIYSFACAGIPALLVCPGIAGLICWKQGFYPSSGCWGRPRWSIFFQVFGFGKDVLLMSLGSQLVNASQIIIISRVAGLDAAATFAIGTKLFTMGQQFTSKVLESSAPALTEMLVRGDTARFNHRFWNIFGITTFLATLGACGLVVGNSAFLQLWTSGAIHWSLTADALLAGLLIATSMTRCFIGIFVMSGNLRPVRSIYFLEGCTFVALAIPAGTHFEIVGVLAVSLFTHVLVTGLLSLCAGSRVLTSSMSLAHLALAPIAITAIALAISFSIAACATNPIFALAATPIIVAFCASVAWFLLLTPPLRAEFASKAQQLFGK